jgi:LDH2 family malate/lactate/ureidoglycolate dehydrogenase
MPAQQPGKGIGHFLGAMRIDAFRPADEYKAAMDHWIRGFRGAKPLPGYEKVLVPGDPEREMQVERLRDGIPLLPVVVKDLEDLAARFKLGFPESL